MVKLCENTRKLLECIHKVFRGEWTNYVKPATDVVCSDEPQDGEHVSVKDGEHGSVKDGRKRTTCWSRPRLKVKAQVSFTSGANTSAIKTDVVDPKDDSGVFLTTLAARNVDQGPAGCYRFWPWWFEPTMRDLHRSGHDLTCATPPTTKLPGPATTHSGSADWDGASPQEQTLMQRNDSQYHRHRWRHSFHHDFWSALRQPYRYIEAVGWSTTLVLGLHLCELRRRSGPREAHTSWLPQLVRFAFSTNDDLTTGCRVLPQTHLVTEAETNNKTQSAASEREEEEEEEEEESGNSPLAEMRRAATAYESVACNAHAARLARAGNYGDAFSLWAQAARSGYGKAHYNLALCYQLGRAVTVNMQKAVGHYSEAAACGHAKAQYNLAVLQRDGQAAASQTNHSVASLLQQAAQSGLVQAQLDLGVFYMEEKKDAAIAVNWFQKAADQNDDTALSYLGLCHQHGLGVHKSLETAFNMYTRASRHGNALADLHLAMFYENGWGGARRDHQMALQLYESAAYGGVDGALSELKRLRCQVDPSINDDSDVQFEQSSDEEEGAVHRKHLPNRLRTAVSSPKSHVRVSSSSSSFESSTSEESEDDSLPFLRGNFGMSGLQAAVAGHA